MIPNKIGDKNLVICELSLFNDISLKRLLPLRFQNEHNS